MAHALHIQWVHFKTREGKSLYFSAFHNNLLSHKVQNVLLVGWLVPRPACHSWLQEQMHWAGPGNEATSGPLQLTEVVENLLVLRVKLLIVLLHHTHPCERVENVDDLHPL